MFLLPTQTYVWEKKYDNNQILGIVYFYVYLLLIIKNETSNLEDFEFMRFNCISCYIRLWIYIFSML